MAEYKANEGWDKEAANEDDVKALLEELGLKVLAEAEDNSTRFYRTGDWQDNLHGELKHADGWPFYRVEDQSEDAVYIEFGTHKTPAHHALGRAIGKAEVEGVSVRKRRVSNKKARRAMAKEKADLIESRKGPQSAVSN